jgi:hypothetical protein
VAGKLGKERLVLLKLYSRQIFNGKRAQTIFSKSVFNETGYAFGTAVFPASHPNAEYTGAVIQYAAGI